MAAPPEVTTLDLSGKYIMNKTLSDDTDEILRLQGVSWFTRKLIGLATITLIVNHYKDESGVEHIDIRSIGTGGFEGNFEQRALDWTAREVNDKVFGQVLGQSRRIEVNSDEIDVPWLKETWLQDTIDNGAIQSYVEADTEKSGKTWIANQLWGFANDKDGNRRHMRRLHFIGPAGEIIDAVLVYDYVGPNTDKTSN